MTILLCKIDNRLGFVDIDDGLHVGKSFVDIYYHIVPEGIIEAMLDDGSNFWKDCKLIEDDA